MGLRTFSLSLVPLIWPLALCAQDPGSALYLNVDNITVRVGDGTSEGNLHGSLDGPLIDKVIDAPSADASEIHNQITHIWFTASTPTGGLELIFDFGTEYDLTTLHFWNFNAEAYDVDAIEFTFYNVVEEEVGGLSLSPNLGSPGGIEAQDIPLKAPKNVQYVRAYLTGSNGQVDFQNIGFTALVSRKY